DLSQQLQRQNSTIESLQHEIATTSGILVKLTEEQKAIASNSRSSLLRLKNLEQGHDSIKNYLSTLIPPSIDSLLNDHRTGNIRAEPPSVTDADLSETK